MPPQAELLDRVITIARAAGAIVMEIYATEFKVADKQDASPVTDADRHAEALIVPALEGLVPDASIVSEEASDAARPAAIGERFWLVDPLDGTREFIDRNGEFTVNIALVEKGVPVLGVVFAPVMERLYAGAAQVGAFVEHPTGHREPIGCRRPPAAGLTVVSSRSHGDTRALDAYLAGRAVAAHVNAGSSLKFCLIACGKADLYPRFGRTMEWDTAAGHAVLLAAGGRVTDVDGNELRYGKPGFANPYFVASAAPG